MASHDSSALKSISLSPLINIALDVGHSSIGWAVITNDSTLPKILGAGVVTFGESCQNSARAGFRRMRRNIASRRNRVKRLSRFLENLGALDATKLKLSPTSAPWRDAARVIAGIETLDWPRLWNVIRWYAHNRGYDGNAAWANRMATDDTDGDTEKEKQALKLMADHRTSTMAQTVCAVLRVDPAGEKTSSNIYFKGYNAAFPRKVVEGEVRTILEAHRGKLPGVDDAFIRCLMEKVDTEILPAAPRVAKRHRGGLLFGQMIPRFDNRIIPTCAVSEKPCNTPNKHCREFYRFRWAQLLGNIRVQAPDGTTRALTSGERAELDRRMSEAGRMTSVPLRLAVKEVSGCEAPNLDSLFVTEEMENALMLDPVHYGLLKHPVWKTIRDDASEAHRRVLENKLFKRRRLTPALWFEWLRSAPRFLDTTDLERRCEAALADAEEKPKRGKSTTKAAEKTAAAKDWRHEEFRLTGKADEIPSGRARYARTILNHAADSYLRGEDPRATGGILFTDPSNPDDPLQKRLIKQATDDSTNNHLVRQRLLVLERTVNDLVREFAGGDKSRVGLVAVEVVRDLQEFSGLNAKETQKLLSLKLKHHRNCAEALAAAFKAMGKEDETTASLIRKFRIADDLGWTCPYTLQQYSPREVIEGKLEIEHIIPRAMRPSDSLDSLVLTYAAVNRLKGARTALGFVKEFGGSPVPDQPTLHIVSKTRFTDFVDGLRVSKNAAKSAGSERRTDDEKRIRRRQKLLLTEHYDKRDADFTARDLTQTSHLVKLTARRLLAAGFAWNQVEHVPGSVTAAVRKSWRLMGALAEVVPATAEKTKDEIRDITHLHHAVDAATLAFAVTKFPKTTWRLMAKRRLGRTECDEFRPFAKVNADQGDWDLLPLSETSLRSLSAALAQKRVRQHLPHSYRGLRVELNPWRVAAELPNSKIEITQKKRTTEIINGVPASKLEVKTDAIKPSKLLGFRDRAHHGKLGANKSALVIADNYGVALDPEPCVIPHFKVHPTLREIARRNGGKWPRVLRNGMIIDVPRGRYQGRWRICSVKDNHSGLALDLAEADEVRSSKINILLATLIKDGAAPQIKEGHTAL